MHGLGIQKKKTENMRVFFLQEQEQHIPRRFWVNAFATNWEPFFRTIYLTLV